MVAQFFVKSIQITLRHLTNRLADIKTMIQC